MIDVIADGQGIGTYRWAGFLNLHLLKMEDNKPVAVIGGGLVGSLQAIFLANRGYKVELFESRKDMRDFDIGRGKSINLALSRRGRDALAAVGCEDHVVAGAIPMYARMIHSLNGKTSSQAYGTHGEAILSVDRQKLNQYLLVQASQHENVSLNFEHKLLRADLDKQSLTFQNDEGKERIFNARFTFGCDGAYSTVRRQMMRYGRLNYQQEYIEHGYKELTIPPAADGGFAMPENYLHIWPRNEFMMIALPNQDRSFTVTLFMPFKIFDSIETEEDLLAFFMKYFPDSIDRIGTDLLVHDFFSNPTGPLVSVKCFPYFLSSHSLILGDAAHAVVPFYGQGMNAGFEDCLVFDNILDVTGDLETAAQQYSDTRWKDTHAIADLSMYNYIEMRSHVNSRMFLFRKHLDNVLHHILPCKFCPLYTMVAFTRIPYHVAVEWNRWQRRVIDRYLTMLGIGACIAVGGVLLRCLAAYVRLPTISLTSNTLSIHF